MAASSTAVTVLAPSGRRQTVKVSPSTPIQQILEEVCKKENFSPDEYDLKFQRTVLNLSLQWRFANLPNNAKLEMVPSTRQRALVESTTAQVKCFYNTSQNWLYLLNQIKLKETVPGPQLSESTPLCVYMRDEIAGEEALKKMTLKSLGLTGGSAIVRYIVKKSKVLEQTETMQVGEAKPKEEVEPSAGVEAAPCKKDVEIPVEKPASSAISTEVQNNTAEAVSHKKESVLNLDIKEEAVRLMPTKDEAIKKQETKPEPSSECPGPSSERPKNIKQEPSAAPDPAPSTFVPFSGGGQRLGGPGAKGQEAAGKLSSSSSLASLSSPGGPPKAKKFKTCSESGAKPIDREALVYHMDAEHRQRGEVFAEDLPDEFFQVTVDDIRKRFAQLKSEREVLEEAPLLTKSLRESRMKEKMQRYPKVVVRVQFPDRHVLQGFFRPLETVGAVREFVRKHLEDPDLRFYLFISPPKVILNDLTDTLFQANLFPAALVYFGSDFKTDCYLQKQILNSTVSSSQADGAIAGCMPRSPTPSSSSMASEATFPPPAEKDTRSDHQSTAADEPQPHSNSQAPKPVNTDPGKIPKWLKLPESPEYLNHVSKQVDKYRHQTVPLKKPTEYPLRIGGLNDTIYGEMEEELEAWENFYMPDTVEMKVVGAIDTFPSLAVGLQLIILAGKDGNIYAYENEVLHQVADCLQDLFENGLAFPGTKIYNYGECFDPMTDDEYSELMQSEEVKRMEDESREFIQSNEDEFLRILARIEEKENAEKVVSNRVVPCNDHSKCAHELTINYFSDHDFSSFICFDQRHPGTKVK
ncbi:Tether containing UBX domain for GLUT4 [Acipenser ruthenus]|uniref:Tether containing UBX domain for GLUT4 n=1 Tax=Acipenser ruthenus TaxID=7906 RepID=A0A662YZY2_ACIRT|nr:Tether containing UBX domain for GLUT4 [Acipenser ruthenus]